LNELGGKVAVVEITRTFRGGISAYGLTIVDDAVSPTAKALFIFATIVMVSGGITFIIISIKSCLVASNYIQGWIG